MSWNGVFYIADIRGIYGDCAVTRNRDEDNSYAVMVRPNDYYSYAEHYQLNTFTDYESCLNVIARFVSLYGTAGEFYNVHSRMYDGFRVESKSELEYRKTYYEEHLDDIEACDDDISEVIAEALNTRIIRGENINAVITNVRKGIGKRKIALLENASGAEDWVDFCENGLISGILSFKGYTKAELYKSLGSTITDVETMNLLLSELKKHGIRSIKLLKTLNRADLYLCLGDFVNMLYM